MRSVSCSKGAENVPTRPANAVDSADTLKMAGRTQLANNTRRKACPPADGCRFLRDHRDGLRCRSFEFM